MNRQTFLSILAIKEQFLLASGNTNPSNKYSSIYTTAFRQLLLNFEHSQLTFTCSKSTIEKLLKGIFIVFFLSGIFYC